MTSLGGTAVYAGRPSGYNGRVSRADFTIGDAIRKERKRRKLSQTDLGSAAAKFRLHPSDGKINKSTVSKVEIDPYTSEFGTILRLVAALGLRLSDIERLLHAPFLPEDGSQEPRFRRRRAG